MTRQRLIVTTFFTSLLSFSLFAEARTISNLLQDVKNTSIGLRINSENQSISLLKSESKKLIFSWAGESSLSATNKEFAPTSPFVSNEQRSYDLSFGVSKLFQSGITGEVSYQLEQTKTYYATRSDINYFAPTLALSLNSNIIQNQGHDRYTHFLKSNQLEKNYANVSRRVEDKKVLVGSLLEFSRIVEAKEEIKYQGRLCQAIAKQSRKLKEKFDRRSVSKREYLLGLKELNNCQATIANYEKLLFEREQNFEATYGVDLKRYQKVNVSELFSEVEKVYESLKLGGKKARTDQLDEVKQIQTQIDALKSESKELLALTKSDLNLAIEAGMTAADINFSDAHGDVASLEYPYATVTLSMDWPRANRQARVNYAVNEMGLRRVEHQKSLIVTQKENRIKVLKENLERDFDIYQKYLKSLNLSEQVLKEADRDFSRGRIDFLSLTDFNKSTLQDQSLLARHRIQLIIRAIEYFDYFQFFDSYLNQGES